MDSVEYIQQLFRPLIGIKYSEDREHILSLAQLLTAQTLTLSLRDHSGQQVTLPNLRLEFQDIPDFPQSPENFMDLIPPVLSQSPHSEDDQLLKDCGNLFIRTMERSEYEFYGKYISVIFVISARQTNAEAIKSLKLMVHRVFGGCGDRMFAPDIPTCFLVLQTAGDHNQKIVEALNHVFGRTFSLEVDDAGVTALQDNLGPFLSSFFRSILTPWLEIQISSLGSLLSTKKGLQKSFMSAAKRLFSSPKTPQETRVTKSGVQRPISQLNSDEIIIKRAADLLFSFRLYSLAHDAYNSARKEFRDTRCWFQQANCYEMMALCSFLCPDLPYARDSADLAYLCYLNTCKDFACAFRALVFRLTCRRPSPGDLMSLTREMQTLAEMSENYLLASIISRQIALIWRNVLPMKTAKYSFFMTRAAFGFNQADFSGGLAREILSQVYGLRSLNWDLINESVASGYVRLLSNEDDREMQVELYSALVELSWEDRQFEFLRVLFRLLKGTGLGSGLVECRVRACLECYLGRVAESAGTGHLREALEDASLEWFLQERGRRVEVCRSAVGTDLREEPIGVGENVRVFIKLDSKLNISYEVSQVDLQWRLSDSDPFALCAESPLSLVEPISISSFEIRFTARPLEPGIYSLCSLCVTLRATTPSGQTTDWLSLSLAQSLSFSVLPPMPLLRVSLQPDPLSLLSGQITQLICRITNIGSLPLSSPLRIFTLHHYLSGHSLPSKSLELPNLPPLGRGDSAIFPLTISNVYNDKLCVIFAHDTSIPDYLRFASVTLDVTHKSSLFCQTEQIPVNSGFAFLLTLFVPHSLFTFDIFALSCFSSEVAIDRVDGQSFSLSQGRPISLIVYLKTSKEPTGHSRLLLDETLSLEDLPDFVQYSRKELQRLFGDIQAGRALLSVQWRADEGSLVGQTHSPLTLYDSCFPFGLRLVHPTEVENDFKECALCRVMVKCVLSNNSMEEVDAVVFVEEEAVRIGGFFAAGLVRKKVRIESGCVVELDFDVVFAKCGSYSLECFKVRIDGVEGDMSCHNSFISII